MTVNRARSGERVPLSTRPSPPPSNPDLYGVEGFGSMANISRLPMPLQDLYEWQYDGACRRADPSLFFSPEDERGPRRRARESAAKQLCARCPVIDQCLKHALSAKEPYGVWGGLTPAERADVAAPAVAV